MPERDIRKALKARVAAYGGEIRAVSWLGRSHAPDVLCLFAPVGTAWCEPNARPGTHTFVETKAPGGKPNEGQAREHQRLRDAGCCVRVISTLDQLDDWLPPL